MELVAGAATLASKVAAYRPRIIALLGVSAYRTAFQRPRAAVGPQPERLRGAAI